MDTVAEVQKLNEVRNLNSQINAQKKMVQAMYGEIGKKLYDQYKETPLDGFEADFQALDGAFEHIEQLREEIRAAKGVTLCPNCKMEVGVDERFCSNCGSKMPEVFRIIDEEDEKELESTANPEMVEDTPEEQSPEMTEDTTEEQAPEMPEDTSVDSEEQSPEMDEDMTTDQAMEMAEDTTETYATDITENMADGHVSEMSEDMPPKEQEPDTSEGTLEEQTTDAEEKPEGTV